MIQAGFRSKHRLELFAPLALGVWAAGIALLPSTSGKLVLAAPMVVIALCWWALVETQRWLLLLLCSLVALPPLPIPMGDSGPHPALLCFGLGLFATAFRLHRWAGLRNRLTVTLWTFTAVLLLSLGSAAVNSGPEIAFGSLLRVLLFAITPFVFVSTLNAPGLHGRKALLFTRILFRVAVAAALFACVDFYFQLPTPAGFGPQYVWLEEGVFRRAQGFFYEASTLGNFCAFFLVMILAALRRPRNEVPCSRLELSLGGAVLFMALVLSYSRGSLVNLLVTAVMLACLQRKQIGRPAAILSASAVACILELYVSFPAFAESYLSRLTGSLKFIWSAPNGVLSGRLDAWQQLADFVAREPWHLLVGIGYKTLPYSNIAGSTIITDNTYLSLLIETGIVGLAVFLVLNVQILRSAARAAVSQSGIAGFFGSWIFCFWVGEMIQMLSGDLITYWRVLPLYFGVLAIAVKPPHAQS